MTLCHSLFPQQRPKPHFPAGDDSAARGTAPLVALNSPPSGGSHMSRVRGPKATCHTGKCSRPFQTAKRSPRTPPPHGKHNWPASRRPQRTGQATEAQLCTALRGTPPFLEPQHLRQGNSRKQLDEGGQRRWILVDPGVRQEARQSARAVAYVETPAGGVCEVLQFCCGMAGDPKANAGKLHCHKGWASLSQVTHPP